MKLSLSRPSLNEMFAWIEKHANAVFSYQPQYLTHLPPPVKGWNYDRMKEKVGKGQADFDRVRTCIQKFGVFPPEWTHLYHIHPPQEGQNVAMHAQFLGVFWVNLCRVLYVIDTENQYGFAYGTLPQHVEKGEELFLVEIDENEDVWYTIIAVSRPQHWLAFVGYPLIRWLQSKFRKDSLHAVQHFHT